MPLSDKPQDVSICCSFGLSNVALQRRRIDHIKSRSEKWNVLHLPRHLVLPKPTRDIEQPQLFAYGKRNEKVYTVIPQPPRKGKTRHPAKFRLELVPSWWITSLIRLTVDGICFAIIGSRSSEYGDNSRMAGTRETEGDIIPR